MRGLLLWTIGIAACVPAVVVIELSRAPR